MSEKKKPINPRLCLAFATTTTTTTTIAIAPEEAFAHAR